MELPVEGRDAQDLGYLRPGGNTEARTAVGNCVHHGPPIGWAGQAAWRTARPESVAAEPGQDQEVLGPGLAGGEGVHRVTASASAAVRPGIWPGGPHEAPAASAGCAALRAL